MSSDEAAELIADTLMVLRVRGWHQGDYADRAGALCIRGALNLAAHGDPIPGRRRNPHGAEAERRIRRTIAEHGEYRSIAHFNDTDGRTFAQVEAVLIRAGRTTP